MSKSLEELVKLSNGMSNGISKKTIRIPSYAIESVAKIENNTLNNIISIDSLKAKNNLLNKPKRTLCLNLGNTPNTTIENHVQAISNTQATNLSPMIFEAKSEAIKHIEEKPIINLASPFFHSPSVFEQYNIEISDADLNVVEKVEKNEEIQQIEEDIHAEANRILEESIVASRKQKINVEVPKHTTVVKKVKHKNELSTKKALPENVNNANNIVHKKKKVVAESKKVPSNKPHKEVKVSAKSKKLDVKKEFIDLDALISQDSINENYLKSINNFVPMESTVSEVKAEFTPVEAVVENIIPVEIPVEAPVKESANPVGILVEAPQKKKNSNVQKASIFNSIFKKFSYDEAELLNSSNSLIDDSPSISNINTISEVQQTIENAKISQEKNVTELNVQASPIATIPVIENDVDVINAIDPSNNYTPENDLDVLNIVTPNYDTQYDDTNFSVESYFDVEDDFSNSKEATSSPINYETIIGEDLIDDNSDIEFDTEEIYSENEEDIINEIIKELDEEFIFEDDDYSELENKIDDLDDIVIEDNDNKIVEDSIFDDILNDISLDDISLEDLSSLSIADIVSDSTDTNLEDELNENDTESEIDINDIDLEDIIEEEINLDDIENSNNDMNDEYSSLSNYISNDNTNSDSENEVESILEYVMSSTSSLSDTDIKEKLLTELFDNNINTNFDEATLNNTDDNDDVVDDKELKSDFLKVIDTLTQTISNLEEKNVQQENNVNDTGKAINIEIDKDDIFSISILNETYEIVADFDGISVLSENIHISTPKNNFFVKIGNKYIEIHNHQTNFDVYTNFEDIEFANALNNVAFTKKNNRFELNIKEAFKLSSIDNTVSLSMLNTSIADIEGSKLGSKDDESSVCDNKTLVISEETQKVYLPYTIKDIMEQLNDVSTGYQTVQDVIDETYTVPLSEFKMPIISRFKEAYKFMREKEKTSIYAAIDLALELMFNTNLNPAIIRACKNLRELNIYLDCLYENELEKFDCFKIIYKVLPKIQ